jgi:hypothetical protein
MHPADRQMIQDRWDEIVNAIDGAGIPRDDLSLLAIVAGAQVLRERLTRLAGPARRSIGFAPATRKEER